MSYPKSLSESPSATAGVAFLSFSDIYTQQAIAGSTTIPSFITMHRMVLPQSPKTCIRYYRRT